MLRQRLGNKRDDKHSAFIRGLKVCIASGWHNTACNDVIQSCHVKSGTYEGTNRKPLKREIPMCYMHHDLQGNWGEKRFFGDKLESVIALANALHFHHGNQEEAFKLIARFRR